MKAKRKVLYEERQTWFVTTDGKLSRTSREPTDGVWVRATEWGADRDSFIRLQASSWGDCGREIYESTDQVLPHFTSEAAAIREAIRTFDRLVAQHSAAKLEYEEER